MLSDILEDLGVDNGQLLLAPAPDNENVRETVIVDAEDDGNVQHGALVLLIGSRGRAALPKVTRLIQDFPTAIAIKGTEAELEAVQELLRPTGIGLIAVVPSMRWDQFESIAKERIGEPSTAADASTIIHRDLFTIAETTATMSSRTRPTGFWHIRQRPMKWMSSAGSRFWQGGAPNGTRSC